MSLQKIGILLGKLSDSQRALWLTVVFGTVLFGSFDFFVCWMLHGFKIESEIKDALQSTIVGLGAGLCLWILLAGLRKRRKLLANKLERLVELNHTVRNSLNVIALAIHAADGQHKAIVMENTARIDQKLRELFPAVGIHEHLRRDQPTTGQG
jgi:hypothetical protein